ncbi:ribonuclease H-like domain-containing protein [Mycena rebaudengoi]|nr:ribonuclease H-like domain-containing protein [Mycena rebaudengoi]
MKRRIVHRERSASSYTVLVQVEVDGSDNQCSARISELNLLQPLSGCFMTPLFWSLCALVVTIAALVWFYSWLSTIRQRIYKPSTVLKTPNTVAAETLPKSDANAAVKQPYDAFLLLDVEATCQKNSNFDYPNEIIEFPVCLMRWSDRHGGIASQLEVVDEFRSFVQPTWRPTLSPFCTKLTGITQAQVDTAPVFTDVLRAFRAFLVQHKLIEKNGKRRLRYCFCSDGPFDIRDFVAKQCFISKTPIPDWMTGDILDVRRLVMDHTSGKVEKIQDGGRTMNIPSQLSALGLAPFRGRLHSGIDDTRNLARIVSALASQGVRLQPNTSINSRRRWRWMGKPGQILEDNISFEEYYF